MISRILPILVVTLLLPILISTKLTFSAALPLLVIALTLIAEYSDLQMQLTYELLVQI